MSKCVVEFIQIVPIHQTRIHPNSFCISIIVDLCSWSSLYSSACLGLRHDDFPIDSSRSYEKGSISMSLMCFILVSATNVIPLILIYLLMF